MAVSDSAKIIIGAVDEASKIFKQVGKSGQSAFDAVGKSMMKVGGLMTAGVTMPLVAGFRKAIDSASDFQESLSKTNVVFGESANVVIDFSKKASGALGISSQAALEAAGTYGNLFTSMGLARDASADMSTELLQLAADLGSFNNIDPNVMLDKLRAGLVGEAEPLRAVGININQATTELKAMELGLLGVGEAMTPAIALQARYGVILDQTKNAQGDFARTSEGLANSQRILKASIDDAVASMGVLLLPVMEKIVGTIADVIQKFVELDQPTKNIVAGFGLVAAATGPAILGIGKLITLIPKLETAYIGLYLAMSNPLTWALVGAAAAVAGLIAVSAQLEKQTQENIEKVDGLTEAYEAGIITTQQYRHIAVLAKDGTEGAANAEAWLADKIREHAFEQSQLMRLEEDQDSRRQRYFQNIMAQGDAIGYTGDAMSRAADIYGDFAVRAGQVDWITGELTNTFISTTEQFEEMAQFVGGDLTQSLNDYNMEQRNTELAMSAVNKKIQELRASDNEWVTDANGNQVRRTDAIRGYQDQLGELQGKFNETKDAHAEMINMMIFDMMVGRAQLDGIVTESEMNLMMGFATSVGIFDEAQAEAYKGVAEAMSLADTDAAAAYAMVMNLAGALNEMDGTVIDIDFNFGVTGPGAGHLGGGGTGSERGIEGYGGQHGLDMMVPPGYNRDNFIFGASSGERVLIIPPGQQRGNVVNNFNMTVHTNAETGTVTNDYFIMQALVR